MVLLDKIVGDSRTRRHARCAEEPGDDAEPALDGQPGQPGRLRHPGAAPNGADYVPAARGQRQGAARTRPAVADLQRAPRPCRRCRWRGSVVSDDPDRPGNPVLWSGNANNTDAIGGHLRQRAGRPTRRCASSPSTARRSATTTATCRCRPTAGRRTRRSPATSTVDGPLGPALNGTTTGFEPQHYDLSAYAGQDVLLGFRYVSDGGVNEGGLAGRRHHRRRHGHQRRVEPGAVRLADRDQAGRRAATGTSGWSASARQGPGRRAGRVQRQATASRSTRPALALLSPFDKVVAIVAYDEPTEQVQQYAPYTLTVNGVVQPGGPAPS